MFENQLMRAAMAAFFVMVSSSFGQVKLDPGFNPNIFIGGREGSFNHGVAAVALQADGKIIVGGDFTNVNGGTRYNLARLNSDGTLDWEFDPPSAATDFVQDIVVQPDGKILYTGRAPESAGSHNRTIVRLNPDGTTDAGFHVPEAYGVSQIILAPDSKIYIAGHFRTVDGERRCYLARLLSDGRLDETFATTIVEHPSTEGGQVRAALQADGKIILAGMFYTTPDLRNGIFRRFNQDGSLDAEFQPGGVYFCSDLQPLPNGQILHVASTQFNSDYAALRIFDNGGKLASTFRDNNKVPGMLRATLIQPDGKIIFGGQFINSSENMGRHLARVRADGLIDASFDVGAGFALAPGSKDYQVFVNAIVAQPDGKLLIGGQFHRYNGQPRTNIVRLLGENVFATNVERLDTGHLSLRWQTAVSPP